MVLYDLICVKCAIKSQPTNKPNQAKHTDAHWFSGLFPCKENRLAGATVPMYWRGSPLLQMNLCIVCLIRKKLKVVHTNVVLW